MDSKTSLLPPTALHGLQVGISVSESSDLARLGLVEGHFRLALGEVARSVLVLGGNLTYGGNLREGGYTAFLVNELQRYARRNRPLTVCLAFHEHRRLPLTQLRRFEEELGLHGRLLCLDADGEPMAPESNRTEAPVVEEDAPAVSHALTSLRRFLTARTHGRVLIGGKRIGFQGSMPGIVEEAVLAFRASQPVYLAGGFGGATLDVVAALKPAHASWAQTTGSAPIEGIDQIAALMLSTGSKEPENGLTEDEDARLAATHRPSEVAALVSLGLGRLAAEGRFQV